MPEDISVFKVGGVLMISMPADPDDPTVAMLQERVLTEMEKHEARGLILDLSKVETLDSFFALTVTETAKMISLMGGKTVIAGMRPAVAITAIQLGLTLGNAATALNIDRALEIAQRWH
jgi:rsbT antagonist protein RsbS